MVVEQKVVREGFEEVNAMISDKLEAIDNAMNEKINTNEEIIEAKETITRVTNEILEEFADNKLALETMLENTMHTVEVEVPDEDEEESDTEKTEVE